jgi:hypothetical protein
MVGAGLGKGAGAVQVQRTPDPTRPATSQPSVLPPEDAGTLESPEGPIRARMKEERVKALNDDRHKRLEDDVSKLQALTTELKTDVDKADKDELSLEVMHKAAEIEKLAHDVQNRMKN